MARLGRLGWWVVGLVAGVALLATAVGVVVPLLAPLLVVVVAAVTLHPVAEALRRRGCSAALSALLGALVPPLLLGGVVVLLLAVVAAQASQWQPAAAHAGASLRAAIGIDPVRAALQSSTWRTALLGAGSVLVNGVVIAGQLAVGVLVGVYLSYYVLRDGPRFAERAARRLTTRPGLDPVPLLHDAAVRLRRYVVGTSVVAAMDAVVITLGAAVLRLPFLFTIAVITFVAAYVPYLGAWISGVFVIVLALGDGGAETALWMTGIVLITQNVLECVLRPYVFGRALDLHPVTVLAATVIGAALGGLCGVFLAPPLAAIARRWWQATRRPSGPVAGA
ncbi:AI-2E family transporter [Dactylosporangium sp. CA-092794]|uniref:AI-2E family transporter n=1 Tax=Dactylosporangium sp. CA-092794 TaxID=3239929 RepID=UPI003D9143E3